MKIISNQVKKVVLQSRDARAQNIMVFNTENKGTRTYSIEQIHYPKLERLIDGYGDNSKDNKDEF